MRTTNSVTRRFVKATFPILFVATLAVPSLAPAAMQAFQEGVSPSPLYDVEDSDIRTSSLIANTEGNPRWNFGVFGGTTYRETAAFPISLPAGAVVTNVTLTVRQSSGGSVGTQSQIDLHSVTNLNFINETTVTWNYANTAAFPWANPGGDYSSTVLGSILPTGPLNTPYVFGSSPAFIAAVSNALVGDGVLRLLAKAASETEGQLMSVWASDSGSDSLSGIGPTARPLLEIGYFVVPEPGSLSLILLGGVMWIWRRRSC